MSLHIGIIPDGNRRFAQENNKTLSQQYEDSYLRIKELVDSWSHEDDMDIRQFTIYVCSQDNLLKRPVEQVELLYTMMRRLIQDYQERLEEEGEVRLQIVGRTSLLPKDIRRGLDRIRRQTKKNNKYILQLAIGYDGREEIKRAFRRLVRKDMDFTDENFKEEFGTDMDIVIRTGKEKRMSGFFPWQTVYSELFFLDIYWPKFSLEMLKVVLQDFENRKRRFGR